MEASPALTSARRAPAAKPERLRHAADRTLEKLYDRHARDVYQYALALLANPADAEDATQTTFLNAYRALLRGDQPHRPHNWLITIAHNVCRMRWRQAGHRPREVALDEAPEPVALAHEHPDLQELLNALGRLTFNQRAALVMRELEGRSCKDIAATLEVSVSSVEALLFRARRHLQLDRNAIGVLTTAPFPATNLLSALGIGGGGGGGGSAAAAGGAALGANLAVKAVALVAVGAIVTGAVGVATHVRQLRNPPAAQTKAPPVGAVAQAPKRAKTHPAHRALPVKRSTPSQAKAAAPAQATSTRPTGTAPALAPPTVQAPSIQLSNVQVRQLPEVQLPQVQLPPTQLPQLPVQLPLQPPQLPPLPPLPPLNP